MPRFELFIPKATPSSLDLRLRLEAPSWIEALKTGLAKVGEGGQATENVLCDIMADNSIHVTDANSGRVFRIIELEEGPAVSAPAPARAPVASAPVDAADTAATEPELPVVEEAATLPEMPSSAPPAATDASAAEGGPFAVATQPEPAPQPAPVAAPPPQPVRVALPADRPTTASSSGIGRALDFTSEATADLLEEIFEISDRVNQQSDRRAALYFMLDLAMNTVGTDAGSVLLADINTNELAFGAARGPKAEQVMSFRVKMGQGIVGFSAESGVGLAVSDATRDPRFYAAISEKIGYPTRSILCVPMQADGQIVGALELINKRSNDTFSERDLGVAGFIGQQLARFLLRGN